MTVALFVVLLLAGTAAVVAPLARRPLAWPADPPDRRDDVARAVSSLRDLEFARAAGTIAPADYQRLRATLERDAFVRRAPEARGNAPVRTLVAASLIAAIAVAVAVFYLPPSAGDRAPGETVTGTVPKTDALAALEARASANPGDVPTQLALADGYVQAGRPNDAIPRYQAVLAKDPNNVAALDGIAKNYADRSFAVGLAPDPRRTSALLMHRARVLAPPRGPRTLQYALHELVTRPRQRTRAEDHAAPLIKSRSSRDL